jgi:hypothetical protein
MVKRPKEAPAKDKDTVIAYWLMPARPEADLFAEMIRILADQLDAVPFEPHLSICVTPDSKTTRKIVKQISVSPIRLRIEGVSFSSMFTKTLFVRFERNAALDALNTKLRRAARAPQDILRDPHVSLLYKDLPAPLKRELAATIRLPFSEVSFDTVKAIRCRSPMTVPADVTSWRTVAAKKLSA